MPKFVKMEELLTGDGCYPISLRTLKKYTSKQDGSTVGDYLPLAYEDSPFFLVMGAEVDPLVTPIGIKDHNGWSGLSVVLKGASYDIFHNIDAAVLRLLAENSRALFGADFTSDQLDRMHYYSPLVYKKEDSDLDPLLSAKVNADVIVVDKDNFNLPCDKASDLIKAGAEVRVLYHMPSLFFKSINQCRVSIKVAKIQLLKAGSGGVDLDDFTFE